ncbi:sigma-54 interaction domain-containing protein [Sporolactobacillus sp. KGMB 08714]|uniref:sigma-54 interaction domain-containing protein n=1 Tax=Sporolactobacillus sp. KGMB 08714 TaxID=3064704 RepID=UPI002FBE7D46
MTAELTYWEHLHQHSNFLKELADPLRFYWNRCYLNGITPETDTFHRFTEAEFKKIKESSIKIYAYSNRLLLQMQRYIMNPDIGFALFDNHCRLLKLYGKEKFLKWCTGHNIMIRTDWSESSVGINAVSLGLETQRTLCMAGSEHFCRALIDAAVYFSPFIIDDDKSTHNTIEFGGIALIVPQDKRNPDYLTTVAAMANDVALHLYMATSLYELSYTEQTGLVSIDINVITGKPHILYHNSTIFKALGISYSNLYFKKATELFDPLPKNKAFWEIIKNSKNVQNEVIPLCIKGVEKNYKITTDSYYQMHLGFRGVRVFITSPMQVSYNVAKRIGNNAIITFNDIIGHDGKFVSAIKKARIIAKSDSNVLILGESGTGKDIFAQAIHNASQRSDRPFIVVNCAAFPRDLIASELFGYEEGAFTGARKNGNIGKFELANTGTIFLDEIGDMPLDLQAMLLRVIEQKSFMRLGSKKMTKINVKIIAATNANLQQLIEQKKFRADLYYRLSTLHLYLPPLRERGNDIIVLAEHFINSVSRRIKKPNIMTLSSKAKDLLRRLPWKGNVRELQNLIEGIVQLNAIDVIEPRHIFDYFGVDNSVAAHEDAERMWFHNEPAKTRSGISKEAIKQALIENQYNKTNAAKSLGISRRTLYRQLRHIGSLAPADSSANSK